MTDFMEFLLNYIFLPIFMLIYYIFSGMWKVTRDILSKVYVGLVALIAAGIVWYLVHIVTQAR
jgi:hypothetical protein